MEALITALNNNIVEVSFTKANGESRVMRCTLLESYLPEQLDIEETIQKKKSDTNIAVWDLDKGSWRSFRKDSVVSWQKL